MIQECIILAGGAELLHPPLRLVLAHTLRSHVEEVVLVFVDAWGSKAVPPKYAPTLNVHVKLQGLIIQQYKTLDFLTKLIWTEIINYTNPSSWLVENIKLVCMALLQGNVASASA